MPDEMGARDVVRQLDARLRVLEQGQRDLRAEMATRLRSVDSCLDQLREGMSAVRTAMAGKMTYDPGPLRGETSAGAGSDPGS
jgi:hypothetical protein